MPRNVRAVTTPSARERDERAAPEALEHARGDQLVEPLRSPGERRTDREEGQRQQEQAARSEAIARPSGQRHRRHVGEQVAVDDPARPAELRPVRDRRVTDDGRQGNGGDHELEAGEEDAEPQERQEEEPGSELGAGRFNAHQPTVPRPPAT